MNITMISKPQIIKITAATIKFLSGGNNVKPKTIKNIPNKHKKPPTTSTFGSTNFGIFGISLLTIKPIIHIIILISKQALQSTH